MSLSTVDADGMPDTRTLLLKNVDDRGWQFATDADSAKGRQVATRPLRPWVSTGASRDDRSVFEGASRRSIRRRRPAISWPDRLVLGWRAWPAGRARC
ncbi:pyridoxamine 5'-phosphate oxidase family protein [Micromonospora sp. U56]|uniref:pyridoxamine 5'-phosphate oxidase family protein n=1 Tax=Micromonospora sp. U56 TaxID=2824900 RepID=UPI001FFCF0CD|nr:pyridoxamine 5'-phosphate oxidase family protein [Micromonospora sp. U56]